MTNEEWGEFKKHLYEKLEEVDVPRIKVARFSVQYNPVTGAKDELLGEGFVQQAKDPKWEDSRSERTDSFTFPAD